MNDSTGDRNQSGVEKKHLHIIQGCLFTLPKDLGYHKPLFSRLNMLISSVFHPSINLLLFS